MLPSRAFRLLVIPVVVVAASQLMRPAFAPWLGPQTTPVQMFAFLAVFIAAWAGGLWAGLLATPLTLLASYLAIYVDTGAIPPMTRVEAVRIALFAIISAIFSVVTESNLRAQRRLAQQRDALEDERARRASADAGLKQFAFLVNKANDFIGVCDLEFRPSYVNRAGLELVGISSLSELPTGRVHDFFFPEDLETLRTEFFPVVMREGHATTEVRFRHIKTGEPIWMEYDVIRMDDADGRPSGFATISRNLEERKRAEQLLREIAFEQERSLGRFRELADSMPQIVWSSGIDGVPDYVNERWFELVGEHATEAGSGSFVHEEDRDRVNDMLRSARETGEPFETEFRLRLPGVAEPRWYLGRALPVRDAHGAVVRWYGTSTDIHAQKQTEAQLAESRQRLRGALDAADTGTFRWNLSTNEVDWDESLDRLFGLAPGSTARSLDEFQRLVHPDDRQRVIEACRRSADMGIDFEEEFRVVWPDGTVRWIYDKGRVYSDRTGRYMTGGCLDITDRRHKEDALRAADRQKDEFLGMLAHELRNPLAPMMYSVAMLERIEDPAAARPVAVIGRQIRRMTRIVDDLLDVSRVTQGKVSLDRETLNLATLVTDAVENSRAGMESRQHTVTLDIADAKVPVSGDAVRLAQVIENLLNNAAKYTPPGGRVAVTVHRDETDAIVTVADNGVGLSAEMLPRVFDLFVQADTSLDRSEGGLGIGLTLVDRLVRLHGGRVEARSEGPGQGSEFTVRLPLINAEVAPAIVASTPQQAAAGSRILIVDDNVDSAHSLGLLLEAHGHEVRLVHDGASAAAAAREFRPVLVLLDIGLPGMDGFEVVRQFRASPDLAALTVVAVTGYGRAEDRARCLEAGFNDHLTKPVDVTQIETVLESAAAGAYGTTSTSAFVLPKTS